MAVSYHHSKCISQHLICRTLKNHHNPLNHHIHNIKHDISKHSSSDNNNNCCCCKMRRPQMANLFHLKGCIQQSNEICSGQFLDIGELVGLLRSLVAMCALPHVHLHLASEWITLCVPILSFTCGDTFVTRRNMDQVIMPWFQSIQTVSHR